MEEEHLDDGEAVESAADGRDFPDLSFWLAMVVVPSYGIFEELMLKSKSVVLLYPFDPILRMFLSSKEIAKFQGNFPSSWKKSQFLEKILVPGTTGLPRLKSHYNFGSSATIAKCHTTI